MKIIKNIFKFLINNILFILLFILIFSINIKQIINKEIIKEFFIQEIVDNSTNIIDKNFDNIDSNKIKNNIKNNKEINKVIDKYTEDTINSLAGEDVSNINITDDIKEIIKNNKSNIEEEYNVKISEQDIDEAVDKIDQEYNLNQIYKDAIKKSSNSLSKNQKQILKLYSIITSIKFIIINSILIFITIIIIGIYKKSYYKWLINLSTTGITASILEIIIFSLFTIFINLALQEKQINFTINIVNAIKIPIISLIIMIILLITYKLINRKK